VLMVETPPTAATMRLDGGHPALDLCNTIYGQVDEPPEHDVLAEPADLVTFARRVGLAAPNAPSSPGALADARALRDALSALLHHRLTATPPPEWARRGLEAAARASLAAARLAPSGGAYAWAWSDSDAHAPVHRLAHAAVALLAEERELSRLHRCAACCWFFLDHSRGAGRRWCSMADCGTEAKKRRYVERRRARRTAL
jgi:predicted RNA-binding Zn ribbon-like protein